MLFGCVGGVVMNLFGLNLWIVLVFVVIVVIVSVC